MSSLSRLHSPAEYANGIGQKTFHPERRCPGRDIRESPRLRFHYPIQPKEKHSGAKFPYPALEQRSCRTASRRPSASRLPRDLLRNIPKPWSCRPQIPTFSAYSSSKLCPKCSIEPCWIWTSLRRAGQILTLSSSGLTEHLPRLSQQAKA